MSTLSKATARKIADEVVTSEWANSLVRQLQSAALASLVQAGFVAEPEDFKVVVEVGQDVLFLNAMGFVMDPVSDQRLVLSSVLCAPAVPDNLGDMGCFVGVGRAEQGVPATSEDREFLAVKMCICADANGALRRAVDVVSATVEHVRVAFAKATPANTQETAQQLTSQLLAALAP